MGAPVIVAEDDNPTALVIDSETTLLETTTPEHYTALIETKNLAGSDVLEIRLYAKTYSTGSYELVDKWTLQTGERKAWRLAWIACEYGYKLTLKQIAGTGRVFPYVISHP